MRYYDKITPDGTRDLLFDEYTRRQELTGRLTAQFASRGYRQVRTPALEFYDVFGSAAAHFSQESMYKLSDTQGRLMVLRPDCTIPIARLAATRLTGMPLPLRLYYCQHVYRVQHNLRGRASEIYQTGVELIGAGNQRSDLEILELAAAALGQIGSGFRIELCHIGYFKALMDSLEADGVTKEAIRQYIEQKNYAALTDLLEQFGDSRPARALKYLPRLFGGEEVFRQAYALFDGCAAQESLDDLRILYGYLCQLGLREQVLIDLGMVNQAEYYTGILFRGYFDGIGEPVLSGGRYDHLLEDFGHPLPAIGFGIYVDAAVSLLPERPPQGPQALLFSEEDCLPQAAQQLRELVSQGVQVENSLAATKEEALQDAQKRQIPRLVYVTAQGVQQISLSPAAEGGRQG